VKMWSGRFRQPLDQRFEQWQRSFPFDQKLLPFELAASRAHALTLRAADVISAEELNQILAGLQEIGQRATEQSSDFLDNPEVEDVHHFVEKKLVELIGETGKKLHSGRSRNEQIATDLRLFVRESINNIRLSLGDFLGVLLVRAEENQSTVMPAYTHLQRAEPVLLSHWLLAYFQMFWRDSQRLLDCAKRVNQCPLGSGAIAGAPLALDRTIASRCSTCCHASRIHTGIALHTSRRGTKAASSGDDPCERIAERRGLARVEKAERRVDEDSGEDYEGDAAAVAVLRASRMGIRFDKFFH